MNPRTKVGLFCDKVLEAGWLLAVILTPLHYNIYTSRTFEPDKLSILRSLALLMSCAWIIRLVEGYLGRRGKGGLFSEEEQTGSGQKWWASSLHSPLVLPVILFFLAYLLSTALSILPGLSMWGSYGRLQGTYSMFSYMVIFLTILTSLREKEQLDRLLNAIILTSIPAALYGVLQHYDLDPTVWSGLNMRDRPGAHMGNPIFMAAYLIMVLPVTIFKAVEFLPRKAGSGAGGRFGVALFICYLFAAIAQLVCILFTQSRGPWLGMGGSLAVFILVALLILRRTKGDGGNFSLIDAGKAFLFSLCSTLTLVIPAYVVFLMRRKGFRWLWLAFVFQALIFAGLIAVLNLSKSPISTLRDAPYIGRLGHLSEAEAGTAKVRAIIWRGTAELIASSPWRMIVGYGPETMKFVWDPHSPPELAHHEARNAAPDRSHNETFDLVVTTGLTGYLIYMVLIGSILFFGLKWLGFIRKKGHNILFTGLCAAGAGAGFLLPRLIEGTYAFSCIGIPAGFVAGLFLYIITTTLIEDSSDEKPLDLPRQILILALLAAIVAHFIEVQTGIAIASTRLYFFVYAALFVITGVKLTATYKGPAIAVKETDSEKTSREAAQGPPPRSATKKQKTKVPSLPYSGTGGIGSFTILRTLPMAVITTSILFTLGFSYVVNSLGDADPFSIVSYALSTAIVNGEPRTSFGVIFLMFITFAVGLIFALEETWSGPPSAARAKDSSKGEDTSRLWASVGLYAGVVIGVFFVGLIVQAILITPDHDVSGVVVYYYLAGFLFLLGIAFTMFHSTSSPPRLSHPWGTWLYPVLIILVLWAVIGLNVRLVMADAYTKVAVSLEQKQQWDESIRFFERAIELAPREDFYDLSFGRALFGKAGTMPAGKERDALFEKIREVMTRAHLLNPRNTDHLANLGLLYLRWAESDSNPEGRRTKLKEAHKYYGMAAEGSPRKTVIINSWAKAFAAQGDYDGAIAKLRHSLSIDDRIGATYFTLGSIYANMKRMEDAIASYRKGIEVEPDNGEAVATLGYMYFNEGKVKEAFDTSLKAVSINPNIAKAHSLLGMIHYKSGRLNEAIEENLKVAKLSPNNLGVHRNLAIIYDQLGQTENAVKHLEKVIALSPESERPTLTSALERLRAKERAGAKPGKQQG